MEDPQIHQEQYMDCPDCDTGFIKGHDTPESHSPDGECNTCPVQILCQRCEGRGYVETIGMDMEELEKRNEKMYEELPF